MRESDESSDEEADAEQEPDVSDEDYLRARVLDCYTTYYDEFCWSIGRGSEKVFKSERGVDFKLCSSKPDGSDTMRASYIHNLGCIHAHIYMHRTSGAFLIMAFERIEVDDEVLDKDQVRFFGDLQFRASAND